ncbi:MAG: PAS domain S-box protein [Alphaproteobacteria bacterium]|nr:PAS domain S-box protein [Alphaproteobacteria bacterium]
MSEHDGPRSDAGINRELQLSGVLSVAPDAIIAVGRDSKIRIFNAGAEKLFGYLAADIMGQSLDELIPARFRTAHATHMERFQASTEQSRLMAERSVIVGVRADGSEFPAEASVSKLEMDGELILTVMLHDVTARKQAEAELIAAKEQAEQALIQAEKMAAVGTLASGIGHEINNPLYAILGAAEAIRDGDDPVRRKAHAQDIIDYCKHVSGIIKNLTSYARPAERHGLEPIDVNEVIAEAIAMIKLSFHSDIMEFDQQLNPVPAIFAKSEDVQQAFFNVIRNGLQAMGSEGTLAIESVCDAGRVSVRVRDTGAGIAPENLAKIYDPFFTTKGPEEGEGIGLFVVRQIVEKYGGIIEFESRVGEGTECTISFPIREPNGEDL